MSLTVPITRAEERARDRRISDAVVVERRTLCREHFEIVLRLDIFPQALPGQFVQVLCRPTRGSADDSSLLQGPPGELLAARLESFNSSPLLRRPFSIASMRATNNGIELSVMGRVVGPGTAWLDRLRADDVINILGPLGRAFSIPMDGRAAVLVAGGVGLPPIRWLGEVLSERGVPATAIIGAQSHDLLPVRISKTPENTPVSALCVEEFARCGIPCIVTTDDGSCGVRGRVTNALSALLDVADAGQRARVYACGPEPMLRAVARMCIERDVPCELAMERVMACGMGTCQSCVIPIRDPKVSAGWRYALCCTEGPVFDADRVAWTDRSH